MSARMAYTWPSITKKFFLESVIISSHRYWTSQPAVTGSPLESVLEITSLCSFWFENNISRPPLWISQWWYHDIARIWEGFTWIRRRHSELLSPCWSSWLLALDLILDLIFDVEVMGMEMGNKFVWWWRKENVPQPRLFPTCMVQNDSWWK